MVVLISAALLIGAWFTSAQAAVQTNVQSAQSLLPAKLTYAEAKDIQKGWDVKAGTHRNHCRASEEFVRTLEFLREDDTIPEKEARRVASLVSQGCDGATKRFAKAYLLMKKSGLSFQKSVDIGLAMVNEDPLTVRNFYEIYEKMYLGEFFNINFQSSLEIAFELSREFKGDLQFARQDFNQFSQFCMDQKKVGLNVVACAKISVRFAKMSQYYPRGLFKEFQEVYNMLRDDKRFGISLMESIHLSEKILKNGPMAKTNFLQAYNYATLKEGLDLSGREALDFAIQMAGHSFKGATPPLYLGEQVFQELSQNGATTEDELELIKNPEAKAP